MTNDEDDGPADDGVPERDREHGAGDELGPKATSDDATMADMGLGGPPAESATPMGQGEEDGVGDADPEDEDGRA